MSGNSTSQAGGPDPPLHPTSRLSTCCASPFQTYQCLATSHTCSATPGTTSQQLSRSPCLSVFLNIELRVHVRSRHSTVQSSPSLHKGPNLRVTCPHPTFLVSSYYTPSPSLHSTHMAALLFKATRCMQVSGPLHLILPLPGMFFLSQVSCSLVLSLPSFWSLYSEVTSFETFWTTLPES